MKYMITYTAAFLLMIPALFIGALYWLWSFKKEKFFDGCKVLDNKYGYGKLISNLLED
jgi:hypothetical protein